MGVLVEKARVRGKISVVRYSKGLFLDFYFLAEESCNPPETTRVFSSSSGADVFVCVDRGGLSAD